MKNIIISVTTIGSIFYFTNVNLFPTLQLQPTYNKTCGFVISKLYGKHTPEYKENVLGWMRNTHVESVDRMISETYEKYNIHTEGVYLFEGTYKDDKIKGHSVFNTKEGASKYVDSVILEQGCDNVIVTRVDADDVVNPGLYNTIGKHLSEHNVDYATTFETNRLKRVIFGNGVCQFLKIYNPVRMTSFGQSVVFPVNVWFDLSVGLFNFYNHIKFKNDVLHSIQEHYPDVKDIPRVKTNELIHLYMITPLSGHFPNLKKDGMEVCNETQLDSLKKEYPLYDYVFNVPLMNISVKTICKNNKFMSNGSKIGEKC